MDSKKDEKKPDLEEIDDLKMSRGEKEEYVIDFNKLGNHIVYDENGNKIRFGDVYKHQKTIIVFTRVNIILCQFKYCQNGFRKPRVIHF